MKKLLVCLLSMAFVLAMGGMALAAVSGPCVNCHTMHNSQAGDDVNAAGPFGALVNNTCLGCHTTSGSDPLSTTGFPYVKSTTGGFTDQYCLAGGFFPSGTDGTDNLGKAHSLGSTTAPPGYNLTWYQGASAPGLSCAGTRGCHGSQTVADEMGAVKGGHHSPTVYRILWNYNGGAPVGITGVGASDYEEALNLNTTAPTGSYTRSDATYAHNVYIAGTSNDTISKLCANCHGDFHGTGTGSGSPWQRHPTDVELPISWDARGDAISSDVDCKYNPFGFVSGATDTTGAKYATCLSCHRAHGTASYDILRFGYNTALGDASTGQSAGSGNMYGCLGCHSKQR
ncbi:MAG: hypothetical protein ACOYU4_12460 [Thermodesulfobacteriota bacterium]